MAMVYAGSSLEMKNSAAPAGINGWMPILRRPPVRTDSAMKRSNTSKSSMNVSSRCGTNVLPSSSGLAASPIGACIRRKLQRLPIGADDEAIVQVLDLIFVIALVRQEHLERQRRVVGIGIPPLRGQWCFPCG